jgi:hypothetical protein
MVSFDLIKGNISQYTLSSILKASHDLLVAVQNANDKQYPFWDVLVLIKWAFLYTKDSPFRKEATMKDVQNTMLLISKLHEQNNPVNFKLKGIQSGFKIIAYQQFWFQDSINEYDIFRTYYFFNNIDSRFNARKEFEIRTGLNTVSFIKCNYYLFLYFFFHRVDSKRSFDGILYPDVVETLNKIIGEDALNHFIKLISFSPSDAEKIQKIRYEPYQLYETTLWNRFPLLKIQDQYCFVHRSILVSMLKYFIFDFLKKESAEFQTEVGARMEIYVTHGIQEMKVSVHNEANLRSRYTLQKVCDFLIDDNILVECKAIGISPSAGINRTKEILRNEFDSTLIKAYIQMLCTAKAIQPSTPLYGIVVTYRDTFTGFGKDAWEEFMDEPITRFLEEESINLNVLPPRRVVFITIEDWDRLVQLKMLLKVNISQILDIAFKQADSGQVLFFEQVLDNLSLEKALPPLSYLDSIRPVFEPNAL